MCGQALGARLQHVHDPPGWTARCAFAGERGERRPGFSRAPRVEIVEWVGGLWASCAGRGARQMGSSETRWAGGGGGADAIAAEFRFGNARRARGPIGFPGLRISPPFEWPFGCQQRHRAPGAPAPRVGQSPEGGPGRAAGAGAGLRAADIRGRAARVRGMPTPRCPRARAAGAGRLRRRQQLAAELSGSCVSCGRRLPV